MKNLHNQSLKFGRATVSAFLLGIALTRAYFLSICSTQNVFVMSLSVTKSLISYVSSLTNS
jgi:hypothetical protein